MSELTIEKIKQAKKMLEDNPVPKADELIVSAARYDHMTANTLLGHELGDFMKMKIVVSDYIPDNTIIFGHTNTAGEFEPLGTIITEDLENE